MRSFLLALPFLAACGGSTTDVVVPSPTEVTPAPETPPAAPPATPPAAGSLTKADLQGAAAGLFPMQPWADAHKQVADKIGEPTHKDDTMEQWVANEGGNCTLLTLNKMGDMVGGALVAAGPCP
jgi:hypothetical protein